MNRSTSFFWASDTFRNNLDEGSDDDDYIIDDNDTGEENDVGLYLAGEAATAALKNGGIPRPPPLPLSDEESQPLVQESTRRDRAGYGSRASAFTTESPIVDGRKGPSNDTKQRCTLFPHPEELRATSKSPWASPGTLRRKREIISTPHELRF